MKTLKHALAIFAILALWIVPVSAQVNDVESEYVNARYFTGGANVTGSDEGSLADIVRELLAKDARAVIYEPTRVFTDSTGADPLGNFTLAEQAGSFTSYTNSSGANAANKAGFDAFVLDVNNAVLGVASVLNKSATPIGMAPLDTGSLTNGSVESSTGEILSVTQDMGGVEVGMVAYADANDRISAIRDNVRTLAAYVDKFARAAGGYGNLNANNGGAVNAYSTGQLYLANVAATGSAISGSNPTVSAADASAEMTVVARNIATLLDFANDYLESVKTGTLSSSAGGTASATGAVSPIAAFTEIAADGSNLAPLAGVNTELDDIELNQSKLARKLNTYLNRLGERTLDIQTGYASGFALEAVATNLSAVDGTGSNAADYDDFLTAVNAIKDNQSALTAAANKVANRYGLEALTDLVGNAAGLSVKDVPKIDAGVDGDVAEGLSNDLANTVMSNIANGLTTLEDKVAEIIEAAKGPYPAKYVAN